MKKTALLTICLSYILASCGGGGGGNNNPTQSGGEAQQLQWVAPSARTDGSYLSLNDISGYKIYSGPTSNNLELIADIADNQATSYDLSEVPPGEYYFGVAVYDTLGLQSHISERVVKTIPE
jgi:hypothetical protein